MLILLALVFASAAGIAVHFTVPHRATRGAGLAPLMATAIAAVIYTALTWSGMLESNPWLWAASLVLPVVLTVIIVILVTRQRVAHDAAQEVLLRGA